MRKSVVATCATDVLNVIALKFGEWTKIASGKHGASRA